MRLFIYTLIILFIAFLDSLVDFVFQTGIPLSDPKHVIVGTVTGVLSAVLFTILYFKTKKLEKYVKMQKESEERFRLMSLTDALTGLYNRRGFMAFAEQQMKILERMQKGIVILCIDVDNLKYINDTFGHNAGDAMLTDIAHMLKDSFRESDIIGRLGGDEFAIFQVETADITLSMLTTRLKINIDNYNTEKDRAYTMSMSIGMSSQNPIREKSLDDMLTEADCEMYEQKRKKKKRGLESYS